MNTQLSPLNDTKIKLQKLSLESGESFRAKHYISTCGGFETEKLLNPLIRKMDFEIR